MVAWLWNTNMKFNRFIYFSCYSQIDDMADAALAVKPDEIQNDLVDMLINSIVFNPDAQPPPYDSPLLFVLMHEWALLNNIRVPVLDFM